MLNKRGRSVLFCIVLIVLVLYLGLAVFFMERFFPGTRINGINCGWQTVSVVDDMVVSCKEAAPLTIKGRNGISETVTLEQFGGSYRIENQIEQLKRKQNGFLWPRALFQADLFEVTPDVEFDDAVFDEALKQLEHIKNQKSPRDAKVVFSDTGYQIQKESEGSTLKLSVFEKALKEAFSQSDRELDLEASGCYEEPEIRVKSEKISRLSDKLGVWFGASITYEIGETPVVIDANQMQQWITLTDHGAYLKEAEIEAFVDTLADAYDAEHTKRVLYGTLQGRMVLTDKKHKWHIDREREKEALLSCIKSGGTIHREPYYKIPAGSHMGSEIGASYVEVDMTAQHMWVYKNGRMVLDTDVVTGNTGVGNGTPEIIGYIYGMQRNRVLRGANYASFVRYWAPFYKGYGLHDANWRGSFGGEIYKRDGSHGCVNIPSSVMPNVYEHLELGMPVITYY